MAHTKAGGWGRKPGSWDTLHMERLFPSSNPLGIPDMLPCNFEVPAGAYLVPYSKRDDSGLLLRNGIAHFFLDDYRFEPVWTRPLTGFGRVSRFWGALTPDFSLYSNWPMSAQIWNTYRSRWIGRYWQSHCIRVVPTVNWSTAESFGFCFAGLPEDSTLAVGVPDMRNGLTRWLFYEGFWEMCNRLSPRQVLVYGKLPFECNVAREFQPDWMALRQLQRRGGAG